MGFCSGTDIDCQSGLACLYDAGSSGKGQCVAGSCCDDTSACDNDKSNLKSCTAGTCTRTDLGYYCMK
jgi:hypothetical protein